MLVIREAAVRSRPTQFNKTEDTVSTTCTPCLPGIRRGLVPIRDSVNRRISNPWESSMVFGNAFPTRLTSTGPVKLASRQLQQKPVEPLPSLVPPCACEPPFCRCPCSCARARERTGKRDERLDRRKKEEVRRCRLALGSAARRLRSSVRQISLCFSPSLVYLFLFRTAR
jgi:hypothetical protein